MDQQSKKTDPVKIPSSIFLHGCGKHVNGIVTLQAFSWHFNISIIPSWGEGQRLGNTVLGDLRWSISLVTFEYSSCIPQIHSITCWRVEPQNIFSAIETNRRSHCVESSAATSYSVPYGEVPYSVKIENVKWYHTTNACILRLGTFRLVFYVPPSHHGQQAHHYHHIVHYSFYMCKCNSINQNISWKCL